jgi:hypothetical protein
MKREKCAIDSNVMRTLMQRAKHLAAAVSGGGARVSDANSISKTGSGDVTKRRRCPTIGLAMSLKLCTRTMVDLRAASCTSISHIGDSVLSSWRSREYNSSLSC